MKNLINIFKPNKPLGASHGPSFGVDLKDLVQTDRDYTQDDTIKVPIVFERLATYLETDSHIRTEGLLRLAGSSKSIKALKEALDNDPKANITKYTSDEHVVASVLKQFLRELPGGLLPSSYVPKLMDAADDVEALKDEVSSLPLENICLLRRLLQLCVRIAKEQRYTKMGWPNLTLVITPTLFVSEAKDMGDTMKMSTVVHTLLVHFDEIFDNIVPLVASKFDSDLSIREKEVSAEAYAGASHQSVLDELSDTLKSPVDESKSVKKGGLNPEEILNTIKKRKSSSLSSKDAPFFSHGIESSQNEWKLFDDSASTEFLNSTERKDVNILRQRHKAAIPKPIDTRASTIRNINNDKPLTKTHNDSTSALFSPKSIMKRSSDLASSPTKSVRFDKSPTLTEYWSPRDSSSSSENGVNSDDYSEDEDDEIIEEEVDQNDEEQVDSDVVDNSEPKVQNIINMEKSDNQGSKDVVIIDDISDFQNLAENLNDSGTLEPDEATSSLNKLSFKSYVDTISRKEAHDNNSKSPDTLRKHPAHKPRIKVLPLSSTSVETSADLKTNESELSHLILQKINTDVEKLKKLDEAIKSPLGLENDNFSANKKEERNGVSNTSSEVLPVKKSFYIKKSTLEESLKSASLGEQDDHTLDSKKKRPSSSGSCKQPNLPLIKWDTSTACSQLTRDEKNRLETLIADYKEDLQRFAKYLRMKKEFIRKCKESNDDTWKETHILWKQKKKDYVQTLSQLKDLVEYTKKKEATLSSEENNTYSLTKEKSFIKKEIQRLKSELRNFTPNESVYKMLRANLETYHKRYLDLKVLLNEQ